MQVMQFQDMNKNISIVNPYNETSSSISSNMLVTEYFFNMLPSYLFILAATGRILSLRKEKKTGIVERVHDSFVVKVRLSHWMSVSYLVAIGLAFSLEGRFFWQANYSIDSLYYLFAILSWNQSAALLHLENSHMIAQEVYTHKIFWSFSFSLNLVRMFQKNEIYICNVVLNTFRCMVTAILTMYAIYKPYDFDDQNYNIFESHDEKTVPKFALKFFDVLESNYLIRKMLLMKRVEVESGEVAMIGLRNRNEETEEKMEDDDIGELFHGNRREDMANNLLVRLGDKRVVAINKRVVRRENQGQVRYYFQIVTQIDKARFMAERRYAQFEELAQDLYSIYNERDFPDAILPVFQKIQVESDLDEGLAKRVYVLEQYLKQLLSQPILMHKRVLEFLNVDHSSKGPYLHYFQQVARQNMRRVKQALRIQQQTTHTQQDEQENESETGRETGRETNPIQRIEYYSYQFEVQCVDYQKQMNINSYEYVLEVSNVGKSPRQSWRVFYSYAQIRRLNSQLEHKLGLQIPYLTNYVPSTPSLAQSQTAKPFLLARQEGIQKYMKLLLANKQYYCQVLMDFLQFNVERDRPTAIESPRQSATSVGQPVTFRVDSFEEDCKKIQACFGDELAKRMVRNVDFNRVLVKVYSILGSSMTDHVYYVGLLEFDQENHLKALVKISKNHDELEQLSQQIASIYYGLDIDLPRLPIENINSRPALITKLDQYFQKLIMLPQIELNPSIQQFFQLQRMAVNSHAMSEGELQVYDFLYH